jgi:hypothetical protein
VDGSNRVDDGAIKVPIGCAGLSGEPDVSRLLL